MFITNIEVHNRWERVINTFTLRSRVYTRAILFSFISDWPHVNEKEKEYRKTVF